MTSKERVLRRERDRGRIAAQEVQEKSTNMTGTELNAVDDRIPRFKEAVKKMNMLERPVGFVCKSTAGRVVRLLQPYDSTVYTGEPEELQAQFGFVWSNDPAKARPFIALSTSPYMTGDCCEQNEEVFRSKIDNNVHAPSVYPDGWEKAEA
ncbi:MAG: hypothetical protein E7235_06190 [Lachnospiraceae bacterium]|nr:hypothetical protein [Lachnospiraceae bacterium]